MKIPNVFHVDLLTPYHETRAYGKAHSQPPPELIDGQEEYVIKEIIADRLHRRKRQYLVRWDGYGPEEDSWVNEKDMHADDLLEDYRLSKT
jgi:hypothetical protein